LQVADGGIAGEVSDNGLRHVARYLQLFPNATYFVIGFGTNDLGGCTDGARASAQIVDNVSGMVRLVREQGRTPLVLNIPDVKESAFPRTVAAETRALRDHHNRQLQAFCAAQHLALIDIRSLLRDEHFGDALHPNAHGASLIAEEVFTALDAAIRDSRVSSR
jgi:lysophospholipase L1-like esterase